MKNNFFEKKILFDIFLVIALFPWITIINLGTDIQPYSAIFSLIIIIICMGSTKLNINILIFLIIPTLNFIISSSSFLAMRGYGAYCCFALVYVAAYNFYLYNSDNKKIIYFSVIIYILVGLIQIFYDKNYFISISSRSPDQIGFQGRGYQSLAAEPTFLGIHMLFIASIYYLERKKNTIFNLIITSVIIISLSSTVIFNIALAIFIYCIFKKIISPFIILISIFFYILNTEQFDFFRPIYLFKDFIKYGFDIIQKDPSIYDRFNNILIPLVSSWNSPLIGYGYESFNDFLSKNSTSSVLLSADRVSSFFGGIIFENGLIEFMITIQLILKSLKRSNLYLKYNQTFVIFMLMILFQSVPISYPLIAILIAKGNALEKITQRSVTIS